MHLTYQSCFTSLIIPYLSGKLECSSNLVCFIPTSISLFKPFLFFYSLLKKPLAFKTLSIPKHVLQ